MTVKDLVLCVITAYADLYARQQALTHVAAKLLDVPGEVVEVELQAWREAHYDVVAREGAERIRGLLQGTGLVPRVEDLPPELPLTF